MPTAPAALLGAKIDAFRAYLDEHAPKVPIGSRESMPAGSRDRAVWNDAYLTALLDILPLALGKQSPWFDARQP